MGLDMQLKKRLYVKNWDFMKPEELSEVTLKVSGVEIPTDNVREIIFDVIYWRKANMIHRWFVENVQDGKDDCGEYYIDIEQLQKLHALCKEALENKDTNKLPTQPGFFFGNTEYNDYYWEDVQYTYDQLSELFVEDAEAEKKSIYYDYYYGSSW